jgi:hypothetical protein
MVIRFESSAQLGSTDEREPMNNKSLCARRATAKAFVLSCTTRMMRRACGAGDVIATALVVAMLGCAGQMASTADGGGEPSGTFGADGGVPLATGSVAVAMSPPGGNQFVVADYTLRNGTNSYSGTLRITGPSSIISFVISGIAPGTGYMVTVSMKTVDGTVSCSGQSSLLNVSAHQSTAVTVPVVCMDLPGDAGAVIAPWPACTTWDTAAPSSPTASTFPPNNTIVLTVNASSPSHRPITFTWTVVAGTGTVSDTHVTPDGQGGANGVATFTCPMQSETDQIQFVVLDGSPPPDGGCPPGFNIGTVTVACTGPARDASSWADAANDRDL